MTEINQGDLEQVQFKQEDNKLFIQKSGNYFLTQIPKINSPLNQVYDYHFFIDTFINSG